MARYTEKAILATFEEMLETMPFDKITVSAHTKRCDIRPNTFYYHYKDIYGLLEHWIENTAKQFLEERPAGEKWDQTFKAVLIEFRKRPNVVYHIFDSLSRDYKEQYIFSSVRMAIYHLALRQAEGNEIEENVLESIADIGGYALLGFFLRFISSRMTMDENVITDQITLAFNTVVEISVLKKLSSMFRT